MKRRYRQHRRKTPSNPTSWWAEFLAFMDLSPAELRVGGWGSLALLVVIGGPIVLLEGLDVSTAVQNRGFAIMVALINLGFTALVLYLGLRHGEAMKMSRVKTWGVAAMFVAMGLLGGLGLWFSES